MITKSRLSRDGDIVMIRTMGDLDLDHRTRSSIPSIPLLDKHTTRPEFPINLLFAHIAHNPFTTWFSHTPNEMKIPKIDSEENRKIEIFFKKKKKSGWSW